MTIPIRKGRALLAYLALNSDEAIPRSRVSSLLWGDHGDEQARNNLRQTLNVLRRMLGPAHDKVLLADRESIGLDGSAVDIDALTFEDLIARGTAEDLEAAVSLYRGDLLDGMDISDPGFQAWLEEERRRYGDLMAGCLATLMAQKRAEGTRQDAIVLAQRLLSMDPLREDVHRALMGLYAELGQRQSALQQYHRCQAILANELAVEPEPETDALYRTLINGDWTDPGLAAIRGVVVPGRRDAPAGVTVKHRVDHRARSAGTGGVVRASRRRVTVAGRVLVLGGAAALSWLLAWGYTAMQPLPDIRDFLRVDALSSDDLAGIVNGMSDPATPTGRDRVAPSLGAGTSLASAAFGGLPKVVLTAHELDGLYPGAASLDTEPSFVLASIGESWGPLASLSDSSGPVLRYRRAPMRPAEPPLDLAYLHDLSGVLAVAVEHGMAQDALLAMQREAEGLWPGLAESWNLDAVRAFRVNYPEVGQGAEADRRIAFLVQQHREAQAELNRLGYDAGPVDGVWGTRSAQAMSAFQLASGLTPDGALSEAALGRLKAAGPATPTPAAPSLTPQPGHDVQEVILASHSSQDAIPDGSRWIASGEVNGSTIFATAIRRGDNLDLVFDVDHGGMAFFGQPHADRYTQSCTTPIAAGNFECWISRQPNRSFGARVFGNFPNLRYDMKLAFNWVSGPIYDDFVLDFRPEPTAEGPKIAAGTVPTPELQEPLVGLEQATTTAPLSL